MSDESERRTEELRRYADFLREVREYDLVSVDFAEGGRVHNWRTHVPEEIKGVWADLSDEARYCVYLMAEAQAAAEEWE